MAFPTLAFEWSPTTAPFVAPSWEDISSKVYSCQIRMGRQHELDRFESGSMTLLLDNNTRTFDPKSDSNVEPFRRFRLRPTYSAVTYDTFSGFGTAYPQQWTGATGGRAQAQVKVVDGFKLLNLDKLNTSYASQRSDVRIGAVLDSVGWPAADRDLRTGQSTMQASTLTNTPALQHIQLVELSENGKFFFDGRGYAAFHDRHAPWTVTAQLTSQATFGDAGGAELPYAELEPVYDDSQIWNEVRVTRVGGVEQVATDSTSQTKYRVRTLTRSGLLITADSEASDCANYLVAKYSLAWYRFIGLGLNGTLSDSLWPHMLGRAIGDKITVLRTPPGGGSRISQDCWIQGIEHNITRNRTWHTRFTLAPSDVVSYWILGDATYGKLNTSARLAY